MGSRVYFGRLARDCRERDMEKLLRNYGEVREIHLRSGYGFVEFRDPRDAEDAIYDLHGREFLGERLIVELARSTGARSVRDVRPPPPVHTSNRVIVENIPSHASWQDLKDFMKKAGEVAFADCHKDRLGEGVVEFHSYSDMKYALERLDDAEFRGQRIRLIRDPSTSSRSRRRERSRTPSRSPRRSSRRSASPRSISPPRDKSRHSRSPRRERSPARSTSRSPRGRRVRSRTPSRSRSNSPDIRRGGSASPRHSKVMDGSRSPSPAPRERSLTPQDNE